MINGNHGKYIGCFGAICAMLICSHSWAKTTRVNSPWIQVKDIIPKCESDYCDLSVAQSPGPGQQKILYRKDVTAAMLTEGYTVPKGIIPNRTKIVRSGRKASSEELTQKALTAITRILPLETVIKGTGDVPSGYVPNSDYDVIASWPEHLPYQKKISIAVEFSHEGVVFRKVHLITRIAHEVMMPVAAYPMEAGTILDDTSISLKRVRSDNKPNLIYLNKEDLIGLKLTRSVRSGEGFPKRYVEAIPIVKRGEGLVVVSKVGAVKISAKAYAREDGTKGEHIRVHVPSVNKVVMVKMVSPGMGIVLR